MTVMLTVLMVDVIDVPLPHTEWHFILTPADDTLYAGGKLAASENNLPLPIFCFSLLRTHTLTHTHTHTHTHTSLPQGQYHGKLKFPANYPFAPPSVMMVSKVARNVEAARGH